MTDSSDIPGPRRYRTRSTTITEVTEIAGRRLAEGGLEALSLRSIAREMDMVPSGIYRHVENRDELLTLLVTDGYRRLADAAEEQVELHAGRPRMAFLAAARAVREIALADPHRHALLYGTPVRDYTAPAATTVEADRLYRALLAPLLHGSRRDGSDGEKTDPAPGPVDEGDAGFDLGRFRTLAPDIGHERAALALDTWAALFGHLSLELFGHLRNTVTDPDRFFDLAMRRHADRLGL